MKDIVHFSQKPAKLNNDYSKNHLSEVERKTIFAKLSPFQKQVLLRFKKYELQSKVLNQFNQTDSDWRFIGFDEYLKFDVHHPDASPLHCACGRGVKYLYWCQGKNGEKKGFGINHLNQEAGISNQIIMEIKRGYHKIDRGIDEILIRFNNQESFPELAFSICHQYGVLIKTFKKSDLLYLYAFQKAKLPIYISDEKKLENLQNECVNQDGIQVQQLKQNQLKRRHMEYQQWTSKLNDKGTKYWEDSLQCYQRVIKFFPDLAASRHFNFENPNHVLLISEMFNHGKLKMGQEVISESVVLQQLNRIHSVFGVPVTSKERLSYMYKQLFKFFVNNYLIINLNGHYISNVIVNRTV
ncbi:hypothetical protein [uncultured Limosilactobacillus sp.]|uniref:hypothetical protein n=1 Tax=uncultured Limosilactobacillus sp. TaxID=2837629 RepID=UPI0025F40B0F|nr:hypothetical protein [uncultured Limosilactobacillus sp.]